MLPPIGQSAMGGCLLARLLALRTPAWSFPSCRSVLCSRKRLRSSSRPQSDGVGDIERRPMPCLYVNIDKINHLRRYPVIAFPIVPPAMSPAPRRRTVEWVFSESHAATPTPVPSAAMRGAAGIGENTETDTGFQTGTKFRNGVIDPPRRIEHQSKHICWSPHQRQELPARPAPRAAVRMSAVPLQAVAFTTRSNAGRYSCRP